MSVFICNSSSDFTIHEGNIVEDLPLFFIHEGVYYTKEFDGFYYSWKSLTDYFNKKNFLGKLQIREVRILLEKSKFKQTICYYTNHADRKL